MLSSTQVLRNRCLTLDKDSGKFASRSKFGVETFLDLVMEELNLRIYKRRMFNVRGF